MTIQEREQEALEVYLKLLKSKGFGPDTFATRVEFLNHLMPLLANKPLVGAQYRQTVETLMDSIPEADWPESLVIAREYFPFWINDIKAVTMLSKVVTEDALPIDWKPMHVELAHLWNTVDQEKFGTAEAWAIKAYTKALRNENAEQALIDTRLKLVKILLVRIKDAPVKDNKAYRIAVDATLPLFELKKNRRLFLSVVREFFYFWSGNPDAEKYILNGNTVSMV
ncbi:MAG TPA: hypothetical protein PLR90_06085 [Methylophilus sp.]|nr:hypothetical protein [Methylophilus sp.]HQQ33468.1 hypothetical protein [Methylophilus sp.]